MSAALTAGLAQAVQNARVRKDFPSTVVEQLAKVEGDLGGRAAIVGMLALAPLTPDLRLALGLLGDPLHDHLSLAEICAVGNILPGELLKHLASAALLKGKVAASREVGNAIGAVVADVMRKAVPHHQRCTGPCQGTGYVVAEPTEADRNPNPEKCPVCQGGGVLLFPADEAAQKLAIEMAHLFPKGGGISIAQITAGGGDKGVGGTGALEAMQRLTDQLLYGTGRGPSVEAEILDPQAPETEAPCDPS